ncbi:MAG: 4-hydroxy-3-methylbut-2-enyl diphosphate reductase, partial [Deltaproteobacteria bacterium]
MTLDTKNASLDKIQSKRSLGFSDDDSVEVTISPNGGACFGVVRAIKLGHQAASKGKVASEPVFSFGAIVHNPKTIRELESQGVKTVEDPTQVVGGTVILRSHGVRQEIEKDFKTRGVQVVDATCPLVKKPQKIAASLASRGYYLVLVGDANHPEVKGVLSYYGKDSYLVTYKPDDIEKIPQEVTKVGVVAQTTIEVGVLNKIVEKCQNRFSEVAVYNTICDATSIRQEEAEVLAKKADVLIVVGGKNSSNTNKLV